MAYLDQGIVKLHETGIRDTGSSTPAYIEFGEGEEDVETTDTSIGSPILRKTVTWSISGDNSKFEGMLLSTEAIGSTILLTGLVPDTNVGASNVITKEASYIGSKTNLFEVQVEGEITIERGS